MEYGFTPEGNQLLDDARLQNERRIQEALRLQAEADENISTYPDDYVFGRQPAQPDTSVFIPDVPERQLAPPESEPQYVVTERETEQHVQDDAPGIIGEFTAGMTYDPVVTRYDVQKVEPSAKNYGRFSAPESEMTFEDKLNAEVKEYQRQQNDAYDRDMQSSPLYRRSPFNKYG